MSHNVLFNMDSFYFPAYWCSRGTLQNLIPEQCSKNLYFNCRGENHFEPFDEYLIGKRRFVQVELWYDRLSLALGNVTMIPI